MKVTANLLQITCCCLPGSSPSISADFVSKTKISPDYRPCGHIVRTWRLQIISPKWPLKSRYTSECLHIKDVAWQHWVPLARRPVSQHSQKPEVSQRAQEYSTAAQRSQRASLRFTLYSKGSTGARGDKPSWLPPGRMWSESPLAIAQGTGQPPGRRLQPIPSPTVPELGSSMWARVHRNSELALRQT